MLLEPRARSRTPAGLSGAVEALWPSMPDLVDRRRHRER
jgi:hypothetical protein